MKIKKYLIGTTVALVIMATFVSCELFEDDDNSVSVSKRIELFEEDVNSGESTDITKNFHSEMKSKLQANWYSIFVGGPLDDSHTPLNFGNPTSITESSVSGEKIAVGVMIDSNDTSLSYSMTMKEESSGDGVWMIKTLNLNSTDYLSGLEQ